MARTIVLYGATGYSGRLIADELKKLPTRGAHGRRVVLAGRNADALQQLAHELDLDCAVFGLDDAQRLQGALGDLDVNVILNAAGPFAFSGMALARAAIALGCHYTDINGEADVYQALARLASDARKAGSAVVGSAGFWAAASNLLLDQALTELAGAPATADAELGAIRIAMSRIQTFSRGSAATVWRSLRPQVTVARWGRNADGRDELLLSEEPVGKLERSFDFGDWQRKQANRRIASAASLVDTLAARLTLAWRRRQARSIESYVEAGFPARVAYQVGSALAPVLALPAVQAVTQQSVALLAAGPTQAERRDERHVVLLEIEDRFRSPLIEWRWETPNVYQFTAHLVAAVADELCNATDLVGWVSPSQALEPAKLVLDASDGPLRGCRLQRRAAPAPAAAAAPAWTVPAASAETRPTLTQRFWLGTWNVEPPAPAPVAGGTAAPIVASGAGRLAIEVLQDGAKYVVLISAADHPQDTLRCLIGFVNGARECSLWRSRGFPVVEAAIHQRDDWLELFTPFFAEQQSAMRYGELLLGLRGIDFATPEGPDVPLDAAYDQFQEAPERGKAASFVLRRGVRWSMQRTQVSSLGPRAVEILAPPTRSPSLAPLASGTLALTEVWAGRCDEPQPTFSANAPTPVPRGAVFGAAAFTFEDVDALGFRIDLADKNADALVAPLNFQQPGSAEDSARFAVAPAVILVQLMRYGRMQLAGEPQPPLDDSDFQSQHELIVRVNTGKMDPGETQLRDPAVHVPAVFVDNPWSKLLGRDLQGFEKCLADFCVRGEGADTFVRLRPDGLRASDGGASELSDVVRINLVDVVSAAPTSSHDALLDIELGDPDLDEEWRAVHPGWRMSDFDGFKVIEGFAERALHADQFRSIQATPVDERRLDKAWIPATCDLRELDRLEMPSAIVHLVFHSLAAAPQGWRDFCELLGAPPGGQARISIQPGDWFRSRFSMDLTVRDG